MITSGRSSSRLAVLEIACLNHVNYSVSLSSYFSIHNLAGHSPLTYHGLKYVTLALSILVYPSAKPSQ